jgi:hypothetical protein
VHLLRPDNCVKPINPVKILMHTLEARIRCTSYGFVLFLHQLWPECALSGCR